MNNAYVYAVVAGLGFGIWPYFMNRSNLSGHMASVMFAFVCLIIILPFALNKGTGTMLAQANWWMIAGVAVFAPIGLLAYTKMISGATTVNIGQLILIMVLSQMSISAIQSLVANGVSLTKLAGIVLAVVAAFLLVRN